MRPLTNCFSPLVSNPSWTPTMRSVSTNSPNSSRIQSSTHPPSISFMSPPPKEKSLSSLYRTTTVLPPISSSQSPTPPVRSISGNSPTSPVFSPGLQLASNLSHSAQTTTNSLQGNSQPIGVVTRAMLRKMHPPTAEALTIAIDKIPDIEPSCYSQAVKFSNWRDAMDLEFNALISQGTWVLVPKPPHMNIVGCKWVYRIKRKPNGAIDRYKARLVAKGFTQEAGIDFAETFSPVVKPTTIRVVLSLAVSQSWHIHQLDVNNAFLNGRLEEIVYMAQPRGYEDKNFPNHVCRLRKSLYGLKQAPRAWYQRLTEFLLEMDFSISSSDTSMFYKSTGTDKLILLVYVDDIIITGNSSSAINGLMTSLGAEFALKDLGPLSFFLGVEAIRTPHGLLLSQKKYINDVIARANMTACKPVRTPSSTHHSPLVSPTTSHIDARFFRQIVGALQYITLTRPDISFAVNKACQSMHSPTDSDWVAVKRILRYLQYTAHYGLSVLPSKKPFALQAFCDSDWAGCHQDRRSTAGFSIFMGPNLISWKSGKQRTVARSSTEAEYKCLADTAAELTWLQSLFYELGLFLSEPPVLWCDNIGATYLAANPVFHARTKHVEVDFHFVREKVARQDLTVRFISTHDQIADIFTKPLGINRFEFLRSKLTVIPPPSA